MTSKILKTFSIANTKRAFASIAYLQEPYGEGSKPVVSIAVSLKGDNELDWKTHIPCENLDELIEALEIAKREFNGN